MPAPILKELIKYGVLGPILAWALWMNSKTTERLFNVIENNTKALQLIKSDSCVEICREAANGG